MFGWYDVEFNKDKRILQDEWIAALDITTALLNTTLINFNNFSQAQAKEIAIKNPNFNEEEFVQHELEREKENFRIGETLISDTYYSMIMCFAAMIHVIRVQDKYNVDVVKLNNIDQQKKIDALEKSNAELESKNKKLETEIRKLKESSDNNNQNERSVEEQIIKATTKVEHEHREALREKDEYINYLEEKIAELQREPIVSEIKQDEKNNLEPWKDFELPQKNVLFLGGHINLTKKLRQIHPDWAFMDDSIVQRNVPKGIQVVFFWSNHSSHKLIQKIYAHLSNDIEPLYVVATNLDNLESEMKREYWLYLERKKKK